MARLRLSNIGGLAHTLLDNHLMQQRQEELMQMQNDLLTKRQDAEMQQRAGLSLLETMKSNPSVAYDLAKQGRSVGGVPASLFAPKPEEISAAVGGKIDQAKTLGDLPTDIGAELRSAAPYMDENRGVQTPPVAGGQQFMAAGGQPDYAVARPDINELMKQRGERERQLLANTQQSITEAGQHAEAVAHGTGMGSEAPDVAGLKRANYKAMTPLEASRAGATAGAAAAATHPYSTPSTFFDSNGTVHEYRFGPKGAEEVPGLPPGLTNVKPQQLAGAQVDELSLLNSAETQGVKVLSQLHKAGLDTSNDPMDPRWVKFVAQTLKMAPTDFNKADIVQRTQFIHAAILRSLMGGRPNQYIAQMYEAHTPEAGQTGEQLTHVLNNVLEQAQSRRGEMEHLTGHAPGSFAPSSGVSYKQYLDILNNEPQGPQPLDPSIAALLARGKRP